MCDILVFFIDFTCHVFYKIFSNSIVICTVLFVRRLHVLKTSNSLMDLRTCGINGGDNAPKEVTVRRQSSFNKKATSLKRFSRLVSAESATCPVSSFLV